MLKTVATAHANGDIVLWNLPTGRKLQVLRYARSAAGSMSARFSGASALAWSPVEPRYLLAGYSDGAIALWEKNAADEVHGAWTPHPLATLERNPTCESLAWSHDGTKFVAGGMDGRATLFGFENNNTSGPTATELASAGGRSVNCDSTFTPDDSKFLCGSWDSRSIAIWDANPNPDNDDDDRWRNYAPHCCAQRSEIVRQCGFSPSSSFCPTRLVSCGGKGEVIVWSWDALGGRPKEPIRQLEDGKRPNVESCDIWRAELVATGDQQGDVWMQDVGGGDHSVRWRAKKAHREVCVCVRFSLDGRLVVSVSAASMAICDALTGEVVQHITHECSFSAVAVPRF